ncbi:Ig-like domain-containing protein [Myroides sp. JBRI-B21084]|uniref:Ig-like domain-containing protein n=1 Tax=Myroides sp. JBRI-B21084 TaxID=3119977 RepID=UPI0026E21182|nr:Ig-like domain-containing protein [Paenimyroides cloacae]WKW45969.1 Ig-like domain-containing protein [Paenimyroides cloacae]
MKSNYFLLLVRHLLFTLTFMVGVSASSQSFIIGFPSHSSIPTQNPRDITVCYENTLLKVRLDVAAASTTGANVSVQLPTGVEYVPGSLTKINGTAALTIAENGGGANAPNFLIGPSNLVIGQFIEFTISRKATCASQASVLTGTVFKDIVSATITGATTATATSSAYQVTYPVFSFSQPATLTNAVLGQVASRTFTLNNGGNGSTNTIYMEINYPANSVESTGLQITGGTGSAGTVTLTPTSTTGTVATGITHNYTITAAQLSGGSLDFGENLIFTESFTVRGCGAPTTYNAGYGSGQLSTNWCQTVTGTGSVAMQNGVPSFSAHTNALVGYVNECTPFQVNSTYTNGATGSAAAGMYNVVLEKGIKGQGNFITGYPTNFYQLSNFNVNGTPVTATFVPTGVYASNLGPHAIAQVNLNNIFTTDPDGAGVGLSDLDGDGFFDDLPAGATVTLNYNFTLNCSYVVNCPQPVDVQNFGGGVRYSTMCDATQIVPNSLGASGNALQYLFTGISMNGYAPANIEPSTNFQVRLSAGRYQWGSFTYGTNSRIVYEITLPPGVSVVGGTSGTTQWVNGDFPSTATPVTATYNQVGQVVTITSPTNAFGYAFLNLTYDCIAGGGASTLPLSYKIRKINDIVTGCVCNSDLACGNLTVNTFCPGPCSFITTAVPVVERADNSLGWTDNTYTTRQSRAAISAYDLSKALYLDEIEIKGNAVMGSSTNNSNLYIRLELPKATGNLSKLTPLNTDVVIKRGGVTVASGNVTTFVQTNSTTTNQVIDWNLTSILPTGGLLLGDVVETISRYQVATNDGLPRHDVQSGGAFYLYNLDASNVKERCVDRIAEMYLVGTDGVDGRNAFNFAGCTETNAGSNLQHFARRFDTVGVQYANEWRPTMYIERIDVTIPSQYNIIASNFINSLTYAGQTYDQFIPMVPNSVSGDTRTYLNPGTWLPLQHTITNNYGAWTRFSLQPNCSTVAGNGTGNIKTVTYIKDYYYHYADQAVKPTNWDRVVTYDQGTNYSLKPAVTLTNQTGSIQAASSTESFVVRMASTGLSTAPYTWLAIPTIAGVTVTQIEETSTGTIITPTAYTGGVWFPLSTTGLATGTFKDYRVTFTYANCNPFDVNVIGGWNCSSYPTSPDEYTCGPATVNTPFHVVPQQAEVQIIAVSMATNINLCSPMQYEYRINSAGAGNTVNNKFKIDVPVGATVVPGSVLAEYPVGSGNWLPVIVTASGSSVIADLTSYVNYPVQGLPGTLTDGGDGNLRLMGIRFQVNTNCDFIVNSSIYVSTSANRSCGEPAVGDGTGTPSINVGVAGVSPAVVLVPQFNAPTPLNNCSMAPVAFNDIKLKIQTPPSVGATGLVRILLPEGFNYVPGSFGCSSVKCPTFNSVITTSDGKRYIELTLPSALVTGDELVFNLSMLPTSNIVCGTHEVTLITLDRISGVVCPSEPSGVCPGILAETGRAVTNIIVNKPQLDIQSVTYSKAIPACGNTLALPSQVIISVKNTSTISQTNSNPANPVVVNFYAADSMGIPTGSILATYTMTGSIAAGATVTETVTGILNTTSTNLVAVISDTSNCVCTASSLVINILPITTCDTATMTAGSPVTVNVVTNDTTGDTVDPTTVSLVASSIPGATCDVTDANGDCTQVTVPGEGVWSVNPTTGAVTFTPASGFTGTPTPITYTVEDAEGSESNAATITLDVLPIATNDAMCYTVGTSSVQVNVLTNDTTGDTIVPTRVSLVASASATSIVTDAQGDVTSFTIIGEGVWSVNTTSGLVTFIPAAGFTGTPTVISYKGYDAEGNASNNATITLSTANAGVISGTSEVCLTSPVTTVTYTTTGTGGTWSSSNTTVATVDASGVVTPKAVGTADITYSVAATVNCPAVSAKRTITVIAPVAITITPATPGTLCVGSSTTLHAEPAGGTWTSNSSNAVITANNADGTAYVQINAAGDYTFNYSHPGVPGVSCPNAIQSFTLVTGVAYPATPSITNTPATCSSANVVKITNYVSTGVNYVFTPAGPTVAADGTISGMTAGETYTVKAVSTSGSCSSAASVTFSLQPQFGTPAAPVSGGNQSVCIPTGSSATLTAVASSQAGTTITWYENSNGTGITSPTYTSSTAYTRTIYAQAVSSQGCASALTAVTQTFYDAPVITNYTTNDPICEVNTKTLYATTPGGVWTVQSGGGTISAASSPNVFTYTPANVTTPTSVTVRYTLTPVAPSVCPPATHDVTFTVNPNPDAPTVGSVIHPTCINANGSFKIANYLATNTYTITSTDGDVISGPTATGTVTATAGTYTISVSNTYGCTGSASIDVTLNPQPATPLTPTISNTPATCSSANIVKVTNLVSGVNYVVSPTGPTVDLTTGVISGMIAGETYTVKAVSIPGGCSSAASTSFSLQAQLVTPAAPTSGGDQVSCSPASLTATASAEAGATITWYADATSTTPVTPTLSTVGMVTYYAEATLGACKSATRTAVTLTINQTPTAPTSGGNITECAASPIQTLTATATSPGNTVVWYTQATGGTALATAPTLNAVGTVTYYAEAVTSANCSSTTRTPVTLTINATPAAPTSGGDQVSCSPASLTASASAEAGATITWYADATSTTPVTPTLSTVGMVTYYAEATLGTCKSATRTPVTLTINQTPDTPTISNTPATCSSANIVKVTNLVSGVNYVVSPTGPTVDVTTGVISGMIAGETYNVKAVSTPGGCSSAASTSFSLQAQLVTPAAPTSGGDQVSCSPASLTATASAEAGATITWYADATSTTPVTPTLSTVGTVTYYAEATLGACKSATRTLVTLTINQTPEAPTSGGDITECATSPIQTLTAIATSTGNTVTWYTQATGGTIVTSPTLNTVGTVTYYAEAVTSANCSSTTRTPVTLTIKATPAVPTLVEIIQPSCTSANGSFKIGNYLATNTYSITSADGSVISGPTATGLVTAAAGTYSIKSILNGCESTPVTVTINPQECADIVTVKTDGQTMYVAGSTVTYTITVTNNGPTAATNVTVADTAPAGTTISSWTGSNGSSGTGDVNNVLPTLAVGQTVTYTVNVAVPATMTGNLTNTVTVTSVTPDPNPACTTCTDTDTPNTTFAENDINNTYADTPVSGNVKTNDSDAEGHGQMVTPSITVTPEGTLFLNANGTYNFIPAAGFTGTFVHTYTICDNATPQACDTATLTIEVMPDPSDPTSPNDVVANNDTATTPEGQPVTIDVKANDFDPNGDAFEIDPTSITQPANGTVTVNPDGTITYTPNPGFEGTDTFTYTVCDDATPTPACDTATVSVNVVPANNTNETYANDDAYNGDQYQPITGNVLDNDTDPDVTGNDQFVTGYTQPAHGTVTIDPITGEFTYTPTDEYTGPLSFTYTICDNGTPQACDIATVYLTINPANETLAVNDINNTYENTPVSGSVSTNDSDPQGHTQTVTPSTTTTAEGTLVLNANGTYTFTPAAGFTGTFVHTYTVCDSGTPQACDTATLTIEVMPDPSDPTSPNDVVANNDTATTPEGQPVTIDVKANDFDPNGDAFEIDPTSITQPANGTVTVNPDGTITYTPNPGFEGTDTFTYTVCDDATPTPACDTATVSVNVVPANNTNETYANDDAYNGDQYQPITGSVLDNDTDPDDNATGNIQTVKSNTQPAHGSVQMNPDGTFTYTPTPGDEYTGPLSFTYEVCDNGNPQACDIATVYLTINPANETLAVNDINNTYENTPVSGSVSTNDSDPQGHTQTVTPSTTTTAEGTLVLNANGTYTFTPAAGFTGTFVHTYTVCDSGTPQACDTATLTIEVMPDPSDPTSPNDVVANNDTATTPEGQPVTIDVKANDFDPNGDAFEIDPTSITQPANGTVTVNPDGTITYTPNPGFEGTDTFTYTVCDDATPTPACDTATVSVNVVPANNTNETYANDDAYNGDQYQPITGSVLDNDTDPDDNATGNIQTVKSNTQPAHGSVQMNPDGTFTYTPTPGDEYTGPLSFTYEVCDNGNPQACDTATVYLTINPANETLAVNDINNTYVNTPVSGSVSTNDSDPQGHTQTVTPSTTTTAEGTLVLNANGTYTFTPAAGFTGTFVHTYTVCDSGTPQACDTATLTIEVMPNPFTGPNDVVANNDTATTEEGQPVTINVKANDFDPNGDTVGTPTVVTQPANGTVTVNPDGTITYTPNPGFEGTDTFTYTVCDDATPTPACDTATVSVNVVPTPEPGENVIYANDDAYNGDGPTIEGSVFDNDSDPDSDTSTIHTFTVVDQPKHGMVTIDPITGEFIYTPEPGYVGPDSFRYTVCDDGDPQACDTATVYLSVNSAPSLEITKAGSYVDTNEDGIANAGDEIHYVFTVKNTGNVVLTNVTVSDDNAVVSGGPLASLAIGATDSTTFTAVHVLTATDLAAGYVYNLATAKGTDPTGAEVTDASVDPNPCSTCPVEPTCVDCTIVAIPNTTHAIDDINNTFVNTPVSGNVLTNDFDREGHTQSIDLTSVTQPANGTVQMNADGSYTYTPNAGFTGVDTFTYTICDNGTPQACETATVTINVEGLIDPNVNVVVANNDAVITKVDTPIAIVVLANDFDPQGDSFSVQKGSLTKPSHGKVTLNADGTVTYTPDPGYVGEDSFMYTICDNGTPQACEEATVIVTILPASNLNSTYAVDDSYYINCSSLSDMNLLDNDYDLEKDGQYIDIKINPVIGPKHGTLELHEDGTFTYTVNGCYVGPDSFVYEVRDTNGDQAIDRATVYLMIQDTTAPEFVEALPSDVTVECNAVPAAPVLTAVDTCGSAEVSYKEARIDGACANSYTLERTWTATDACGNTTVHTQIVTVEDTTGPSFVGTMPAAEIYIRCEELAAAETLQAQDECGEVEVRSYDEKVEGDCESKYDIIRTWVATDSCGNETRYTQTIHLSCPMEIFNAVTPNGDGMNDEFVLKGINCYPGNTVEIYNRWGVLVYETRDYNSRGNTFKGYSEGRVTVKQHSKLPTGTYYYVVKYTYDLGDGRQYPTEQAGYLHLETN